MRRGFGDVRVSLTARLRWGVWRSKRADRNGFLFVMRASAWSRTLRSRLMRARISLPKVSARLVTAGPVATEERRSNSYFASDTFTIIVMLSPLSKIRPMLFLVPFFLFTSSVSSSTRFMYSSKPCARHGEER